MIQRSPFLLLLIILLAGCDKEETITEVCSTNNLLDSFTTQEGIEVFIYENGDLFTKQDGNCVFEFQYFDPAELENTYQINTDGIYIVSGNDLLPIKNDYIEDFETSLPFTDLFIASFTDTDLFWTSFTLQSPLVPLVDDYVALRNCILDGTCTFKDNKIELAPDPMNGANQTLKFTSVAPTPNMVTAKASIASQINYFVQGSDLWFEADYFIESGIPFSIVDFESDYFEQSPGPRVVIRNNQLEIENKFGTKISYTSSSNTIIPNQEWFTLKVHLKYSYTEDGIIELWQNGEQLINATGINLPLSIAIQNILEVGISATPEACVMYVDNIRVSGTEF